MREYLRILNNVLVNGQPKQPTRFSSNGEAIPVENGTRVVFGESLKHSMNNGFPLLTCRKMPFKSMCTEVEGFIKGITSKQWFKDRGCNYWNYWANPEVVNNKIQFGFNYKEKSDKKKIQEEVDDLGPIYGSAWRKFGEHYSDSYYQNGVNHGYDQLKYIVNTLKTNPYDRRMVCSAWNPNHNHIVALNPCHYAFNCVVIGNQLNLVYHMRSVDWILGSNLGLYGLLLTLLAKESGLEPGTLMGTYSDCHIYDNQIEDAKELLKREPLPLPTISFKKWNGIWNWEATDTVLENYNSHPGIKFALTV